MLKVLLCNIPIACHICPAVISWASLYWLQQRLAANAAVRAEAIFSQASFCALQVRLNKWLTELEQMFYGMAFSFDQSLRGEADLTAALLKNVYNEDANKQKSAALLARYITRYNALTRCWYVSSNSMNCEGF